MEQLKARTWVRLPAIFRAVTIDGNYGQSGGLISCSNKHYQLLFVYGVPLSLNTPLAGARSLTSAAEIAVSPSSGSDVDDAVLNTVLDE